jgi:acyl dehydratase
MHKTARSLAFLVAFGISGQAMPAEFNEPVIINGSLTVTGDVVINAPWGKVSVRADKEGLIIQNLTGTDGGAAALIAQTQWGEVKFAGNELRVTSTVLDPAKVRIGSPQKRLIGAVLRSCASGWCARGGGVVAGSSGRR